MFFTRLFDECCNMERHCFMRVTLVYCLFRIRFAVILLNFSVLFSNVSV